MSAEHRSAIEALEALDRRLDGGGMERLTLDPSRTRASTLAQIGRALAPRCPPRVASAFAAGLARTADAIARHFPNNLFWDLDHLAASVLREALAHPAPLERLGASFDEIETLNALFGRETPIRFRYAHDFIYGFDWAKWVRRDPKARAGVGPFDLAFLRSLHARGRELLALIENDDATYPALEDERDRNPYPFSRDPREELALYRDLARLGLIPVRAWQESARPEWDRAFAEERVARARALGLIDKESAAPPR
jgi:hypothetical protein